MGLLILGRDIEFVDGWPLVNLVNWDGWPLIKDA